MKWACSCSKNCGMSHLPPVDILTPRRINRTRVHLHDPDHCFFQRTIDRHSSLPTCTPVYRACSASDCYSSCSVFHHGVAVKACGRLLLHIDILRSLSVSGLLTSTPVPPVRASCGLVSVEGRPLAFFALTLTSTSAFQFSTQCDHTHFFFHWSFGIPAVRLRFGHLRDVYKILPVQVNVPATRTK